MAALLENILLGKQYLAVEFFHSKGKERMALLQIQKKSNELVIAEKGIFINIDALSAHKSKAPLALIINNDQILQKEVQGVDPADKKLLHKAFPNLQVEEFYYEIFRHNQVSIIAICRKTYVDELLNKLSNDFKVAAISLGVTGVSSLSGFALPPVLTTNTQRIDLDTPEHIIGPSEEPDTDYDINGLSIPNTHLLAFCGILKFIIPTLNTGSLVDLDVALKEQFKQKAFFEKGIQAGIAVLLGLLLVNFLLFSYYFDKATEMTETVALHKSGIENITKIKQRIKEKQQRLASFTSNAASASSLVINELVRAIPSSILLSEINYHPLEKKVKTEEAILVKDNVVLISGVTLSNTDFTGWVEQVQRNKWVSSATISSFGKDPENNTIFSVIITLKK